MIIRTCLFFLASTFAMLSHAQPALTLYHLDSESAAITDIGIRVMTIDGISCYQNDKVSKFTQRLQIDEMDLSCDGQEVYAVYGAIPGYWSTNYIFLADKYPRHGGECTIRNEKDSWLYDKLTIKCSDGKG